MINDWHIQTDCVTAIQSNVLLCLTRSTGKEPVGECLRRAPDLLSSMAWLGLWDSERNWFQYWNKIFSYFSSNEFNISFVFIHSKSSIEEKRRTENICKSIWITNWRQTSSFEIMNDWNRRQKRNESQIEWYKQWFRLKLCTFLRKQSNIWKTHCVCSQSYFARISTLFYLWIAFSFW